MIRLMKEHEILQVARLLESMVAEVFPSHYTQGNSILFIRGVQKHIDDGDSIYVDDALRGFFIVKDVTDIVTPSLKIYEGTRVYIKPEYRKGRLLSEFYQRLYDDFQIGRASCRERV